MLLHQISGLVYTVVHDPPGEDSFASIRQGTNIDLELAIETTRALSADKDTSGSIGIDVAGGVEIPGVSAGSAPDSVGGNLKMTGKIRPEHWRLKLSTRVSLKTRVLL